MQLIFALYSQYKGESGMKGSLDEMEKDLEKSLIPDIIRSYHSNTKLPTQSMGKEALMAMLSDWSSHERKLWNGERHYESGTVYHGRPTLTEVQNRAYCLFSITNPLHPNTFPFIRKMESEVIAMTLSLFHGSVHEGHCGILSSGGTESIILAVRAYKKYAATHRLVERPNLVIPSTAHAAFDKACDLMDIELIKVDVDPETYTVSASAMEKCITSDTIAIVGSTPNYPHGTMDPIVDLAALAKRYDIGLHVDCCLGSFLVPLLGEIGYTVDAFDFAVDGVTSISCDTHKFGFANKGTSVLMFREKALRKEAYFCYSDCVMGMYSTPTCMGSRSGGLIAATWTTMMFMGRNGYSAAMKEIMTAVDTVKKGAVAIPEIEMMGNPVASVIAFKESKQCPKLQIFQVGDALSDRGWSVNRCQKPDCIHICLTVANCGHPDKFVEDLKASVREVVEHPEKFKGGSGAMYGAVISIPSSGFKNDILSKYMDVIYNCY